MKRPRAWEDRLPGYVLSLRDLASSAGLATALAHNKDDTAVMTWRGTEDQHRATDLFPDCMAFPVIGRTLVTPCYFRGDSLDRESDRVKAIAPDDPEATTPASETPPSLH
jgi:hypothetical protein